MKVVDQIIKRKKIIIGNKVIMKITKMNIIKKSINNTKKKMEKKIINSSNKKILIKIN